MIERNYDFSKMMLPSKSPGKQMEKYIFFRLHETTHIYQSSHKKQAVLITRTT